MTVIVGDCREVLAAFDADSIDAVVTDPPYELNFMGKSWDARGVSFDPETWRAALRVLKPGGHLLAFGGTRTYHRIACAIEDAGFEIRDQIAWLYGSGFPKSLDVSKAMDQAAGMKRDVIGAGQAFGRGSMQNRSRVENGYRPTELNPDGGSSPITAPATADAERWSGWGTALKPAHEPIVVARKPLIGTVAANVLAHGTGALNIDACRIGFRSKADESESKEKNRHSDFGSGPRDNRIFNEDRRARGEHGNYDADGRWPANVVLDEQSGTMLDEQAGIQKDGTAGAQAPGFGASLVYGDTAEWRQGESMTYGSTGGASRFFYCAKTSRAERNAGLQGFKDAGMSDDGYGSIQTPTLDRATPHENWDPRPIKNNHPTVKPISLMRWLARLITPPGGTILDPFLGSGSTGCACALEGFKFMGIELDAEYVLIAEARIAFWSEHGEEALRIMVDAERAAVERGLHAESGQLDLFG